MKRFYRAVTVEPSDGSWRVLLDGRPIKTAGGRPQLVPTRALTEAMAAEWSEQGEEIDTERFNLRRLADYAIDIVAPCADDAVRALLPFAETDTLCYRADRVDALYARQVEVWEPLVAAAEARWEVAFERIEGIIHRPQPAATLVRLHAALVGYDHFTLAAINELANLAASLVIALAAVEPGADAQALWDAAILEEGWQAGLWGRDAEAEARRTRNFTSFAAAMCFAALARSEEQA
jgi:chaperone required for assembly of F1-ATPase